MPVIHHAAPTAAHAQHSSVAAILKENPKTDVRRLVPGTPLRVPVPAKPSKPVTSKPGQPAPPATKKPGKSTPAKPSTSTPTKSTSHPPYAPKPTRVVTYAGTAAAKRYPAAAVASGDRHRRQLAGANLPDRPAIRAMIVSTAKRYGVDPVLALAIGWQESGHRQSAVSVCDAIGTMQVMPGTGRWAAGLAGRKLDLMQAQDNITAGVVTLRFLTQHAANRDQAIAAYYQGLGAVRAHGLYADTKRYVVSVTAHMKRFSA